MYFFWKEEGGRCTYGLQVDSKCSCSTELTSVPEKGEKKINVNTRKGETTDVHVYCIVLCVLLAS